jgi:DNA-dependent protein kinase catalytic subunit
MAISKEHYKFDDSQEGKRQSEQVKIIWNTVSSPLMDDFVTELRRLTNPEHIVKDFIDYAMVRFAFLHVFRNPYANHDLQ